MDTTTILPMTSSDPAKAIDKAAEVVARPASRMLPSGSTVSGDMIKLPDGVLPGDVPPEAPIRRPPPSHSGLECHMRSMSYCQNEPHCTEAGECVLFLAIPKAKALRWPLVRITWVDSTGPRMWTRLDDVTQHHDMTVESVGWLVQDDADRIAIAAHVQPPNAENPMLDGVLTIPTCAITRRVVIAEPA